MRHYAGTSGFAYGAWRGGFYPENLPERKMLAFYGGELNSVEINSTFYRFPTASLLTAWARQVPEDFRFAVKVPRRITHAARLRNVDDPLLYLIETVLILGPRLGPLLFQLPPDQPKALDRCEAVLKIVPPQIRSVFEFRHQSWFDSEVRDLFTRYDAAVCFNDAAMAKPLVTGGWGYIRRRRAQYRDEDLSAMAAEINASPWTEVYTYFKHEEAPEVPLTARRWLQLVLSHPDDQDV